MKSTKIFISALLVLLFTWAVFRFWNTLKPFIAAAVIAFIITPVVDIFVIKLKLPRILAVVFVVFLVLALILGLLAGGAVFAATQLSSLAGDIVSYAADFDRLSEDISAYLERLHLPGYIVTLVQTAIQSSDVRLSGFLQSVIESIASVSAGIFDIVIVIILTVYFALDGRKLIDGAKRLMPPSAAESFSRVLSGIHTPTWRYVGTQVLLSFGMAAITYFGLTVMGLKYALLFAFISFILDFIPYFGSLIAGSIEVLYALITGSVGLAIAVAVFVIVVQQIEGNIAAPKLQGDAAGLHPVVIMFALLACNSLWGPLGMLISTPIAISVKAVLSETRRFLMSGEGSAKGGSGTDCDIEARHNKLSRQS